MFIRAFRVHKKSNQKKKALGKIYFGFFLKKYSLVREKLLCSSNERHEKIYEKIFLICTIVTVLIAAFAENNGDICGCPQEKPVKVGSHRIEVTGFKVKKLANY